MVTKRKIKELTERQKEIYNVILEREQLGKRPPTVGELGKILNKSRTTIFNQLKLIEKKGYLYITPKKYRGIMLIDPRNIKKEKEINYDKYIYNNQDDIKKEKYVKHGLSKSNKSCRRGIWS